MSSLSSDRSFFAVTKMLVFSLFNTLLKQTNYVHGNTKIMLNNKNEAYNRNPVHEI